jgi:proline iminopeptidase
VGPSRGGNLTVSVKGAELFYSTRGAGPACLVLSGIGTRPYERQTPSQLSDRLKLVYVDLRGSGRSTGEPTDLTFDVLADDLEAIRADLDVDRIAVLGHSILGILAIEYGRRCPGSVSHVITAGTPPSGDIAQVAAKAASFFEEDASSERKRLLRDNLAQLPPDAPLRRAILAQTPTRFFDPRFDAAPLFEEAVSRPTLLQHVMGTLAPGWDVTAGASALRLPLFLAHGRYDYVVPYFLWEDIAPKLPNATLQIFHQSGHQPFFEEPERFAEALMDWMGRYP